MNKRKFIPVAIALVAVIAVSGVAYAYWTASGSGSGTGSTTAGTSVTVHQTSTLNPMYPGLGAQTLSGDFINATGAPVFVASVSVFAVTTSNAACTAADFTVAGSAPVGAQVPVGNPETTVTWTGLTIQFKNDLARNQDACKGVTVTLTYAIP